MRRILVSNYVTLDGLYAGPNGEIDWFIWDDEMAQQAKNLIGAIDTILFGRVTYEGMAAFWPTATTEDPVIARAMNSLPKVVFSRTLHTVDWNNSRLIKGDLAAEVQKLKQQPGRDMVIYGSGQIVQALTNLGLIDRYLLFVNPIVVGAGKSLFEGVTNRPNLKLLQTKAFRSGVVLLDYQAEARTPRTSIKES